MDTLSSLKLRRVVRALGRSVVLVVMVVAFCWAFVQPVQAAVSPVVSKQYCVYGPSNEWSICDTSFQAACAQVSQQPGYHMTAEGGLCRKVQDGADIVVGQFEMAAVCPAGTLAINDTQCQAPDSSVVCPAGQVPGYLGLGCIPADYCAQKAKDFNAAGTEFVVRGNPAVMCETGCALKSTNFRTGADGVSVVSGPYVSVGGCTNASTDPKAPSDATAAPAGLPAGKCTGTVNATAIVVDCASSGSQTTTKTDTSSTAPGASSPTAGSSTEVTTSRVCTSTKCETTTVTTTTNPDGSKTGSTSKVDGPGTGSTGTGAGDGGGGAGSTFNGTCAETTCTGDAVQCAMAKEQAKRMCELMDTPTPLSQKGLEATTAGDQPGDHPGLAANRVGSSVNFGSSIDQSNPWGDACVPDQTIPINVLGVNQSFVIPWSSTLCEPMLWMGRLAVALTFVLCARLLIRSV